MLTNTHREANLIQQDFFRRMPAAERLLMALEMSDALRRISLEGLRSRRPELSHEELSSELMRLMYGVVAKP
jgi:hypothetical protein